MEPVRGMRAAKVAKSLSENLSMKLEQRRISPRMGLPKFTICKGDAPSERGYHNEQSGLLPPSSTSVEETQKAPAQKEQQQQAGRQAEGVRQGRSQRYLVRALDGMPVEGRAPRLVRSLLKRRPRAFPEVEEDGSLQEADEQDG